MTSWWALTLKAHLCTFFFFCCTFLLTFFPPALFDRLFKNSLFPSTIHREQVPFGPLAFMPGKLVHTNEVTVLLGDNWFAKCSAKQARGIVAHRMSCECRFPSSLNWFPCVTLKVIVRRCSSSSRGRCCFMPGSWGDKLDVKFEKASAFNSARELLCATKCLFHVTWRMFRFTSGPAGGGCRAAPLAFGVYHFAFIVTFKQRVQTSSCLVVRPVDTLVLFRLTWAAQLLVFLFYGWKPHKSDGLMWTLLGCLVKQKRAATAPPKHPHSHNLPPPSSADPPPPHPAITELSAVIQTELAEMCQTAAELSGLLCLTFPHFQLMHWLEGLPIAMETRALCCY